MRTAGRILVGLLFVWAGIDKIQGWQGALAEVAGGGLPVGERVHPLGAGAQLPRRLGAAQQQHREQRPLVVGQAEVLVEAGLDPHATTTGEDAR